MESDKSLVLTCLRKPTEGGVSFRLVSCDVAQGDPVVGPLSEPDKRMLALISQAKTAMIDELQKGIPHKSFIDFRLKVPVAKMVPGEETHAEAHVGTIWASRSTGKPVEVSYSPTHNIFQISNGHHRWAEAKATKVPELDGNVSIFDEEKGFGTYTVGALLNKGIISKISITDIPPP